MIRFIFFQYAPSGADRVVCGHDQEVFVNLKRHQRSFEALGQHGRIGISTKQGQAVFYGQASESGR
jgi:hypothetical protein